MRILITGGSGYIGGRLAQYLSNKNFNIFIGTRKSEAEINWFPKSNIKKVNWNDENSILNSLEEIDVVIHLAALNARECSENKELAFKVNVENSQKLLKCASKKNVKKILYFSTIHVYGSPLIGNLDEENKLDPIHTYAKTHYEAENIFQKVNSKNRISNIIIRLSNAFGAPVSKEVNCWHLVFNDFVTQAAKNSKIVISSEKNILRDFITIEDVCRATEYLVRFNQNQQKNIIYNVGQGHSISIYEIAKLIQKRFQIVENRKISIEYSFSSKKIDDNFNFSIKKLINAGYNLTDKSYYDNEIDRLIKFCLNNN